MLMHICTLYVYTYIIYIYSVYIYCMYIQIRLCIDNIDAHGSVYVICIYSTYYTYELHIYIYIIIFYILYYISIYIYIHVCIYTYIPVYLLLHRYTSFAVSEGKPSSVTISQVKTPVACSHIDLDPAQQ